MNNNKPYQIARSIAGVALTIMLFMLPVNINAAPPQIDSEEIFGLESNCVYADFPAPLDVIDTDSDTIMLSVN